MSTLQEHLEDAYDVDVEEEILKEDTATGRRFVVDDEDKASWALRKLARIRAEEDAINAQFDRESDRLNSWFMEAKDPLQRQRSFFEGLLQEFHATQLASDPSKKSIKLPAGTLKSRVGQNKWTVDADSFLEWFDASEDIQAALPELVRVKREPSMSAIKAAFEPKDDRAIDPATGEIVAGVTVEPGQRTFSVEVAE